MNNSTELPAVDCPVQRQVIALLPERDGQARLMMRAQVPLGHDAEIGHWYSPAAVREMLNQAQGTLLQSLVVDEARCMTLLKALDKTARDENSYEYGLPLWGEPQTARLREVLYRWACGAL